jgi:uncharacterized protein (TIGR02145 family)
MSTSFIVFNIIGLVIVVIAAFRIGMQVSKAAKLEAPEAKNNKSYDECLAKNNTSFKYGSFTDARDGETYRTIKIGNQVWMAENLRYKTEDSFAPGNEESNVAQYGRLYKWTTALNIPAEYQEQSPAKDINMYREIKADNYQGIAPEGWHIPSIKEWETLMENLPAKSNGAELRSECVWQKPGTDTLGFFALPAGYRFDNGAFCQFGKRVRFWCKEEYGTANAYRFNLTEDSMDIEGVYRSDAISVRCVKNA